MITINSMNEATKYFANLGVLSLFLDMILSPSPMVDWEFCPKRPTWMSQEVSKWLVNGLYPTYKWPLLGLQPTY